MPHEPTHSVCELPFGFKEQAKEATTESISFVDGILEATRFFKGPWVDRYDFIDAYLFPRIVASTNDTSYGIPGRFPDFPSAIVHTIETTGMGKPTTQTNTGPLWERALVEATYKTPNFNLPSGGSTTDQDFFFNKIFIEESIDSHGEFLSIDGRHIKDADDPDNKPCFKDGRFNITLVRATIILKQVYIVNPRWDILPGLLGKVNLEPFLTPGGFFCPIETLRYDGPFATTKVNVTGGGDIDGQNFPVPVWEISHRFEFNRVGWQKAFCDGVIVNIVNVNNNLPPFERTDLRKIFYNPDANNDNLLGQLQAHYAAIALLENDIAVLAAFDPNDPEIQNKLNQIAAIEVQITLTLQALGVRL